MNSPKQNRVVGEDRWYWWAGDNEDEYRLAGPCATREDAINEAYGATDPGDTIHVIEARAGTEDDGEGLYPFIETRNRGHVTRKKDKPVKRAAASPKAAQ